MHLPTPSDGRSMFALRFHETSSLGVQAALGRMHPAKPRPKGKGQRQGTAFAQGQTRIQRQEERSGGSTGSTTGGQQQGHPKGNPRRRRGRNRSPNPRLRLSHPLIRLKRVLPPSPGLKTTTVTPLLLALQMLQFLLPGVSPWITLPMHVPSILPSTLPSIQVSLWMIKAFCPPFSIQALHTAFCPYAGSLQSKRSCQTHSLEGCIRYLRSCPLV